jgi:integrase
MAIYRKKVNGRKVWWVRVNYRRLNASRVCESREAAKDAEAELREALRRKVEQSERAGLQPATVKALFEAYVADLEARGKGPDTVGRAAQTATAVEAVLPELLTAPVGQLKEKDIFAFREARTRAGAKPGTVNRDLRTIRAMLKKARPDFHVPAGVFFPEDETRVRWLRPEDEILVLETMPSPFREIAKLAALTLMRQGEIRTLRREMVRLEQGVVLLPRTKGEPRSVVLSEGAQKILQRQLETHEKAWVFPSPEGVPYSRIHVSRVFRKAARAAGLKDFRFHDLRHHGATMALNAGFTAPIVMQLGGWKTEKMMRRYAAVTDATLRAAAEAVSGSGNGNGEWKRRANSAPALATPVPSQG